MVGYTNLEFRREIWVIDINLGLNTMYVALKATRQGDTTEGMTVDRSEKQPRILMLRSWGGKKESAEGNWNSQRDRKIKPGVMSGSKGSCLLYQTVVKVKQNEN